MDILEKIIAHKQQEVDERKQLVPVKLLEKSIYFDTPVVSLKKYLLRPDKSGIIAEFKRASPSKGAINPYAKVERVTLGYMQSGASALSVLTDEHFFKGNNADLTEARKYNFCPILRKDFILDEYQIIEAKSIGADVILLIAECLDAEQVSGLASFAKQTGLEVLLEVHGPEQLDKITPDVDILGVNNRNLKDFTVSIETSIQMTDSIPNDMVKISESGIRQPEDVVQLRKAGYQGFLIGELFMREGRPQDACAEFIKKVRGLVEAVSKGKI